MLANAFLRAILENPEDDSPRLIYADWLEEEGDSDRAEFIRVQCALEHSHGSHPNHDYLKDRECVLIRRNQSEWDGVLPQFATQWVYQRGFVDRMVLVAEPFLRHADVLEDGFPLCHIKLRGTAPWIHVIAEQSALQRLTSLDLGFNHLDPSRAVQFFRGANLPRLKALNLCWNTVGLAGVRALAAAPSFAALRALDLERNSLDDEALHVLASIPHLSQLVFLNWEGNRAGADGIRALIDSQYFESLQRIHLRDVALSQRSKKLLLDRFGPQGCRFS